MCTRMKKNLLKVALHDGYKNKRLKEKKKDYKKILRFLI